MTKKIKRNGFTMTEIGVTITVLGILFTIIIPPMVSHHRESINRVKIKKSMAYYENFFKNIAVKNNCMTDKAMKEAATPDRIHKQFKYINIDKDNQNIFRSAENIWWDTTDILHPKVAIRKEDLAACDKDCYYFSGHIERGVLKLNDMGYITNEAEKKRLEKTYNYVNKSK